MLFQQNKKWELIFLWRQRSPFIFAAIERGNFSLLRSFALPFYSPLPLPPSLFKILASFEALFIAFGDLSEELVSSSTLLSFSFLPFYILFFEVQSLLDLLAFFSKFLFFIFYFFIKTISINLRKVHIHCTTSLCYPSLFAFRCY